MTETLDASTRRCTSNPHHSTPSTAFLPRRIRTRHSRDCIGILRRTIGDLSKKRLPYLGPYSQHPPDIRRRDYNTNSSSPPSLTSDSSMAPSAIPSEQGSARIGPHPSYIEIAKPYILQSRIQSCLSSIQMSDAKEDAVRLQGVSWIDAVRRALSLPIRTFNTAVIYYHKFRLLHADNEYNWADASAAALFTACKIEDTLKKSREILCASWNLKVGPGEALSSDDPRFDIHSKQIIGLERLMLESAGFDFRNRYPQKLMVKLARALKFDQNNEGKTAWNLSVDLYRTFAPLKQNTPTLAIACVELAARLYERDPEALVDRGVCRYAKWGTSRGEVMGKFSFSRRLRYADLEQKPFLTFSISTHTTAPLPQSVHSIPSRPSSTSA